MTTSDDYVRSEVKFVAKTPKAVLISSGLEEESWVPRSVLYWQCDIKVDSLEKGETFTIILREWFASKIGLQY